MGEKIITDKLKYDNAQDEKFGKIKTSSSEDIFDFQYDGIIR